MLVESRAFDCDILAQVEGFCRQMKFLGGLVVAALRMGPRATRHLD